MRRLLFALALFCVSEAGWSAEYPVLVKDPLGFPVSVSGLTVDDTGTTFTIGLPMNLSDAAFDSIFSDLDVGQLVRKDKYGNIGGGRNIYLGPKDAPAALIPGGTFNGVRVISSDDSEIVDFLSTANNAGLQGQTETSPGVYAVDFLIATGGGNQYFNNSAQDRDFSIGVNGIANFFNLDSSDPSMNIGAGHVTIGSPSVENTGAGDLNVGDDLYVEDDGTFAGALQVGGTALLSGIGLGASGDFVVGASGGGKMGYSAAAESLYIFDVAGSPQHSFVTNGPSTFNAFGDPDNDLTIRGDTLALAVFNASTDSLDLLGNFNWDASSVTGNASTGEWTFASEIQADGGGLFHDRVQIYRSGNTYGIKTTFANPLLDIYANASTGNGGITFGNASGGNGSFAAGGASKYIAITQGRFEVQQQSSYTQSTLTIASGVVTQTKTYHVIAAESGTADDLDTISGPYATGTILFMQADAGDTITVKDGTGNIQCGSDFAMTGDDVMAVLYDGTNWRQWSRSSN